jgi:hypothetical protein
MENRGRVQLHEACVIPYRHAAAGVQFCLVSPVADSRWEFPKVSLDREDRSLAVLLGVTAKAVGLRGHVQFDQPLGQFEATRGSESRSMTGYLLQVDEADDAWPSQGDYRRLWCLAEEARIRIRRKPLRRFIDLALHSASVKDNGEPNGARRPQPAS